MNNLLNEIEKLSQETQDLALKINKIDVKIEDIETEQLQNVIKECKGGFKFNKIVSQKITWNNNSNWRDDEVEYFDEKGVFLTEYNDYTNRDVYGSKTESYELWLKQSGELKVYKCVEEDSNWQDASNKLERFFVSDNILEYFEFEDVLEGIKEALERRMASLNNRTKAQEERLKKLEKFM